MALNKEVQQRKIPQYYSRYRAYWTASREGHGVPQRRTHDQKSAERGGGESRSRLFKQGQTTDMIPQEMDMER